MRPESAETLLERVRVAATRLVEVEEHERDVEILLSAFALASAVVTDRVARLAGKSADDLAEQFINLFRQDLVASQGVDDDDHIEGAEALC